MKTKTYLLPLVVLLATGCASPYKDNGLMGGFSDTRLAPDVFRITFRGNGYTSAERAQDFALLRASELVLQGGFTHFAVLDSKESVRTSTFSTPGTAQTTTYGNANSTGSFYGNTYQGNTYLSANSTTTYTPGQTHIFYKPSSGLLVRAFREKPENVFTFDAAFLREQVANRYKIQLKP